MGNICIWRFNHDLQRLADKSIQQLFYSDDTKELDNRLDDILFKICYLELNTYLNRLKMNIGIEEAKKIAIFILKILRKFIMDFQNERVANKKNSQLLCWEWDKTLSRYITGGKKSHFEIKISPNIGYIKRYCSNKFKFDLKDIHLIHQDHELHDKQRLGDVCKFTQSFVHLIYLLPEHNLNDIELDVFEMERGTPQKEIEKCEKWSSLLFKLLNKQIVGDQVVKQSWQLIQTFPGQSGITHVLKNYIIDKKKLPIEIAGLIASFTPSSVQEIHLNID